MRQHIKILAFIVIHRPVILIKTPTAYRDEQYIDTIFFKLCYCDDVKINESKKTVNVGYFLWHDEGNE